MSMPSDVTPDVAEAAKALKERAPPKPRRRSESVFRKVSAEQYGFAAATIIAFLGIAVCGPKVQEMRKPRRQRLIERMRRAARDATHEAQRQARDVRDETRRRLQQLGDTIQR